MRRFVVLLAIACVIDVTFSAVIMVVLDFGHSADARIPDLGFWAVFVLLVAISLFRWHAEVSDIFEDELL